MCLCKSKKLPIIATKDVECWKILSFTKFGDEIFYRTSVREVQLPSIPCVMRPRESFLSGIFEPVIEGEGVHAYLRRPNPSVIRTYECIARCTVPKGAMYYIDKNSFRTEIAASKVIVNEVVFTKDCLKTEPVHENNLTFDMSQPSSKPSFTGVFGHARHSCVPKNNSRKRRKKK